MKRLLPLLLCLTLPACETPGGAATVNGQPVGDLAAKPSWKRSAFAFSLGWNGINVGFAVPAATYVPAPLPQQEPMTEPGKNPVLPAF